MKGIIIKCEVLYFATFRKPSSTSLILTYLIPPFTTVRGIIANALGLQQHDYSLQDEIKVGIRLIHPGYKNVEMAKILKLKESPMPRLKIYPSSPMFKEYLVKPEYEFYIGGEENKMKEIYSALDNLKRPLYLGQSDDLVDIEISDLIDIEEKETNEINSVVDGIHTGCTIEKLPFVFKTDGNKYTVEYKVVSIPKEKITLQNMTDAYLFNDKFVSLF